MAIAIVGTPAETAIATASTTHVVNLPSGAAGNLFVAIMSKGSAGTTPSVNALTGWTELLDEAIVLGLFIAYKSVDGTEGTTTTFTLSSATRGAWIVYEISGHEAPGTQAPQIGTTATGTSATPDPPAVTPTGGAKDYLWVAFSGMAGEEADDDTWGNTPPTNYTPSPPRQKSCGTAGTSLGGLILSAERALNAASEDPGTFGVDVSAAWRAQTIVIHPSSASPQNVAVTGRTSSSSFGTVTISAGGVSKTVAGRSSVSSFGAISTAQGGVSVQVTGRNSASSFGTATPAAGNVNVAVSGRTSTSSFGTVTAVNTEPPVPVTGHTSTSSYGTATALPGGVTVSVTGRTSVSNFGIPTAAPGNVNVNVSGRSSTSLFGAIVAFPGNINVSVEGWTSISSYGSGSASTPAGGLRLSRRNVLVVARMGKR